MLYQILLGFIFSGSLVGAYFLLIRQPKTIPQTTTAPPATQCPSDEPAHTPEAVAALEAKVVETIKRQLEPLSEVEDELLVEVMQENGKREACLKSYAVFLKKLLSDTEK